MKKKSLLLLVLLGLGIAFLFLENKKLPYLSDGLNFSEQPSAPKVNSTGVLLENLSDDHILLEKNVDKKVKIASLTKLMTLYVFINENTDLDQHVRIEQETLNQMSGEGAALSGFIGGDNVSLRDLCYGMTLPSGADAAITAATYTSENEDDYVKLMNQYAQEMGMKNTHFSNVTGLDSPTSYSTASDLRIFMKQALDNPTFQKIVTTLSYQTTPTEMNPDGYHLTSTLLGQNNSDLSVKNGQIIGGKTGYTDEAGQCLISISEINNKQYLLITTGANGNPENKPQHIIDSKKILNNMANIDKSNLN